MSNVTIDGEGRFVGEAPANQAVLAADANGYLDVASSYIVDSPEMREMAHADLTAWKRKLATMEEKRLSITRPIDMAKKAVMELFRPPMVTIESAISILSDRILKFDSDERAKAAQEQRRLDAIARAERDRLEAEAEAERKRQFEAEEKVRLAAVAAQRAADEEARKQEEEQTRLKNAALAASRSGELEAARELEAEAQRKRIEADKAAQIESARLAELERVNQEEIARAAEAAAAKAHEAAVTSAPVAVAAKSTGARGRWKGQCTNKMELLKFIIENPSYLNLVDVNETALNAMATAQKAAMSIGGCSSYQAFTVAAAR